MVDRNNVQGRKEESCLFPEAKRRHLIPFARQLGQGGLQRETVRERRSVTVTLKVPYYAKFPFSMLLNV